MNENNDSSQRVCGLEPEQDATRSLAGGVGGETQSDARIMVRIERRGLRLLDPDNLYGAHKYIIDALRTAELIPGDDPESINLIVTQTRVKCREEIQTIVEITYA